MMLESDIIPFSAVPPFGERALVLAPHPDDETLGCGGTIRLLLVANKRVKVVFLTSGEQADHSHNNTDYAVLREKEAGKALGLAATGHAGSDDCGAGCTLSLNGHVLWRPSGRRLGVPFS